MAQITQLPLHGGRAPRWLFGRMVRLGGAISRSVIDEYGPDELLGRLCDSGWFQALSCAIGYDWHSSGTTTVTLGALKEALNEDGSIFIAGGKGKAGVNTPNDIVIGADRLSIPDKAEAFTELSRLSAKIDSSMVYDDIGIYHHTFLFTGSGRWGVVQQGMSPASSMAVRFQWISDRIDRNDISNEPHSGVDSSRRITSIDLTSSDNSWVKPASLEALQDMGNAERIMNYPKRHGISPGADLTEKGIKMLRKASDADPSSYRELLLTRGVGRSTIRSLAIISSLIYDRELARRDPVSYAYNLGGKDGVPYTINRRTYDSVIREMEAIVDGANLPREDKYRALRALNSSLSRSAGSRGS